MFFPAISFGSWAWRPGVLGEVSERVGQDRVSDPSQHLLSALGGLRVLPCEGGRKQ